MKTFFLGAATMGAYVAGLYFFRFWRQSRDRLFLGFAAAFWIFGAQWTAVALIPHSSEMRPLFYAPRVVAFLLIIAAIIDKNRSRPA